LKSIDSNWERQVYCDVTLRGVLATIGVLERI